MDDETLPAATGECPSAAELASFVRGYAVELSEHVPSCPRCRSIVARTQLDHTRPSSRELDDVGLTPGTLVGRYRIVERLGYGGMGVVYHAVDSELERPVALKLVRAQIGVALDELTERLRRESRLQARASHPNVITVHDIGRDGDRVYVAMELAHGGTLGAWLAKEPRSWRSIVDVFRRAGEGLAAAHAAGLVHRDFKPDNVLVEEHGSTVTRVLVTDFGVARAVEAVEQSSLLAPHAVDVTTPGALVGTPAYMAPEQIAAGPVDARTDVFAFGVGLWEALYGERPYAGNSVVELELAMARPLREPPPREDWVPRWLDRVLRRALATEPADRFSSMAELLHALDWRHRRRRMWLSLAVATAVLAVAAGGVGWAVLRTESSLSPSPCELAPATLIRLQDLTRQLRIADVGKAGRSRDLWVTALDDYAPTTRQLRADVCHAVPRAPNWKDRLRCIDHLAEQVTDLMAGTLKRDAGFRERYVSLPVPIAPFQCATDVAARLDDQFLTDDRHGELIGLLLDLDDTIVEARSRPDDARRRFDDLEARAKALKTGLALDVAYERELTVQTEAPNHDVLRKIAVAAEREGNYRLAGHAWIEIASEVLKNEPDRGRDLLAQCDAALNSAGNPPRERATWALKEAFLAATSSDAAGTAKWEAAAADVRARGHIPPDHEYWNLLGEVELRIGNVAHAYELHKRAYEAVAALGELTTDPGAIRESYAASLIAYGKADDAGKILEPVVAQAKPSHRIALSLATAIDLLAVVYNQTGRNAEALRLAQTWQEAIARDIGPGSFHAAKLDVENATAALGLGRVAEAERASASALHTYTDRFGADTYDTADVRVLHGQALLRLGRTDVAREELERGAKDLTAAAGETDLLALQARIAVADAQLRQHQPDAAIATIDGVMTGLDKATTDAGLRANAELILGEALVATHRELPRARTLIQHALERFRETPTDWATEIADATAVLAKLH